MCYNLTGFYNCAGHFFVFSTDFCETISQSTFLFYNRTLPKSMIKKGMM